MEADKLNPSVPEEQFEAREVIETKPEPTVDFSAEDEALAADAPEFDLGEEDAEIDNVEMPTSDFSQMTKQQLVETLADIVANKPVQFIRRDADAVKVAFYKLHRMEVEQFKKAHLDSGADESTFAPAEDPYEKRLKDLFVEYRNKRNEYASRIDSEKESNLKAKLSIIEELKELVNSTETINNTFNAFRDLQNRWKETGVVPQANIKDLWETYHMHVENFYNFIKINKELRDLDLKKNHEAKIALCEDAESLTMEPSVTNAFHRLQKLHDAWREIGPVANELKDQIWERFKAASTIINKKHQEYYDEIKSIQLNNLALKTELCNKTEELAAGVYTSRKEWNAASDTLIEIQTVWKSIGFAPKKDNTKIYERFRNACDKFFENKRAFYMQFKEEMQGNLQAKIDLCVQAESLKDSEEWKKTTDMIIDLQKRWKEIGAVSRKQSDAVWKRFREACDHFFARKSEFFSKMESKYDENLQLKQQIIEELKAFVADGTSKSFEYLKDVQRRWSEVGFVPIKVKDAIQAEYRELVNTHFAALRGNEREVRIERFKEKISGFKDGADKRLRTERDKLYNKVRQLEADISLWENNIGFFAKSKNAEAMIKEVKNKMDRAKAEVADIIEKVKLIDKNE